MRNYWVRILVGALVVFALGMIGVTLVRHGMGKVKDVVSGSGPLSIPLAIIPFEIGGNKLGTLDRLVLERTAPKNIASVMIEVKLDDSLVAQGLSGCRLAANLEATHHNGRGVHVNASADREGLFRCLAEGAADSTFVEFGRAVLQPGNVELPLYLPQEMVADLQRGTYFSDSTDVSDSIAGAMESLSDSLEAMGDSIAAAQERKMDSLGAPNSSFAESLRVVGRRRADSVKLGALRLADSLRAANLKENASRPR
ncbi:MAG: hypothetical protein ABI766_02065 [Gemmatimonadales bacterium]